MTFTGTTFVERSTISRDGGLAGVEIFINGLAKTYAVTDRNLLIQGFFTGASVLPGLRGAKLGDE